MKAPIAALKRYATQQHFLGPFDYAQGRLLKRRSSTVLQVFCRARHFDPAHLKFKELPIVDREWKMDPSISQNYSRSE